jgi:polysaccharide deacetylase family protein (PEP-CTERM system associated)
MKNIITFDVEDWYHCLEQDPGNWHGYADRIVPAVHNVLDILQRHKVRGTFFVLGYVAEHHSGLIREIHAAGHEIASHGFDHQFVYLQTVEQFRADVSRSISLIESVIHQPVVGYRAPYFSVTRSSSWALTVLRELGIIYDSSIFPVLNHRYGIPSAPRRPHTTKEGMIEVPVSTYPISKINIPCGGGVYFRFLSYPFLKKLYRRLNKNAEVIVFYLHPWELDTEEPRIKLPPFLSLRHYWGHKKAVDKLERLLTDFQFGSIKEVLKL